MADDGKSISKSRLKLDGADNPFDSVEPHRYLPDEARAALWSACELVLSQPGDFVDAVTWLEDGYSEAAMRGRLLQDSKWTCRLQLRQLRNASDLCDTFPRRKALRHGHTREEMVKETIDTALLRGRRIDGDRVVTRNEKNVNNLVDATNVEVVWRWLDEKCRRSIQRIKAERKGGDNRANEQAKDRSWRLEQAVGDAVKAGIPAGTEERLHADRALLLASLLSYQHELRLPGDFCTWPWQDVGSFGAAIGEEALAIRQATPYMPGRCTVLFGVGVKLGHDFVPCHWLSDFAGLVERALMVPRHLVASAGMGQVRAGEPSDGIGYQRPCDFGESHLYPPMFVVAPQTSFANAWEVFCCDVINRHEKTTNIYRRKPPERGVDLYWQSQQIAYQCKSVEDSAGRFKISKAVASLQSAMKIRETLPWKKYVLCSNVALTGPQEQQLRAILPDIELLTPSFWLPRCQEQSAYLGGRFQRLEPMGARHHGSGN